MTKKLGMGNKNIPFSSIKKSKSMTEKKDFILCLPYELSPLFAIISSSKDPLRSSI